LLAVVALALAGCASRPVSAPISERTAAPAAAAAPDAAPGYLVRRGDTLYAIALEHGLDYRELAQWNGLSDPSRIRDGQNLRLSDPNASRGGGGGAVPAAGSRPRAQNPEPGVAVGAVNRSGDIDSRSLEGASAAAPPAQAGQSGVPVKSDPKALRRPYSKENLALLSKDEPATVKPAASAPARADPLPAAKPEAKAEPEGVAFIWPAKGRVIGVFSEPANKGVDIDGRAGDPVLAAAPGRVMYTGTGIRGYGKLIVIKHEDGYNSVYAHNREILVKEGQAVVRGERIAELGDSDAERPKLHFEIRKSGKPVDPMRYLEPRS